MDLDFKQILLGSADGGKEVEHHFERDALIIGCIDCRYKPDPGTQECMRCMVDKMTESGGIGKIVLRTSMDIEVSGQSGQIIRRIASIKRSTSSMVRNRGRCRRCPMQRNTVMEVAWKDFPYPNYYGAKALLKDDTGDDRCARCISSTRRALSQMESDLEDVRRTMVRP